MPAGCHDEPENRLALLLAKYDEALAAETPASAVETDASRLTDEMADEWRDGKECIELLDRVCRLWPKLSGDTLSGFQAGLVTPIDVAAVTLGRFRIRHQLGHGGLGIVYLAFDPKLSRLVALKVPRTESLLDSESRRRFLREAEAAARLNHPHIVSVHDAGEDGPICYIAAEYCAGPTLAAWLKEQRGPTPIELAARILMTLAAAIEHAHGRGVLHRDIKPSNVMLATPDSSTPATAHQQGLLVGDMQFCPKLTDFGMAKLMEREGDDTRNGALIGTPAYMAPEQAEGRVRDLDARTDVYALGVVFYELLTGRRPHEGQSDVDILRRVLFDEPIAPRSVRPAIPRDLEAICLKCLAKRSDARYRTAQQLVDDLARFLNQQPTEARPLNAAEKVLKWARRRPALAGVSSVVASATVVLLCVVFAYNRRLAHTVEALREQRETAQRSEREAREYAYGVDIIRTEDYWNHRAPHEAHELLSRYIPKNGEKDLRGPEWDILWKRFEQGSVIVARQPTPVWSLATSTNMHAIATGDTQGVIRLWNRVSRVLVRELRGHEPGHIDRLVFTADGSHLLSAADDHTIRWWNLATGETELIWREHTDWVGALEVSKDGQWIASGGGEGRVLLWNAKTRTLDRELYRHPGAVRWVVFHPIHPWVISACEAGEVRVWNYATNSPPKTIPEGTLPSPENPIWRNAVFRPDGKALFAGDRNSICDWNLQPQAPREGRLSLLRAVSSKVLALALLEFQGLLIEGGNNDSMLVTHRENPLRPWHYLRAHTGNVRCLVSMVDNATLLSGSDDGTVRQWDLVNADPEGREVGMGGERALQLSWSATNDRLWIMQANHQFCAVDHPGNPLRADLLPVGRQVRFLTPLANKTALLVDEAGSIHHYDGRVANGPLENFPSNISAIAVDAKEKWLACVSGQTLSMHDASSGKTRWQVDSPSPVRHIIFLGDEGIAAACEDGVVRRFRAIDGQLQAISPQQRNKVNWLDISDDGRFLVTCSTDKTVRILDADTLVERTKLARSRVAEKAWFIDHGRRLLIIDDKSATIVNSQTGQILLTLIDDLKRNIIELSPDGHWLAMSGSALRLLHLKW